MIRNSTVLARPSLLLLKNRSSNYRADAFKMILNYYEIYDGLRGIMTEILINQFQSWFRDNKEASGLKSLIDVKNDIVSLVGNSLKGINPLMGIRVLRDRSKETHWAIRFMWTSLLTHAGCIESFEEFQKCDNSFLIWTEILFARYVQCVSFE